jgi:hypothetical protein
MAQAAMSDDWIEQARTRLLSLRSQPAGWGYQATGASCVEPTVLASLGLMATQPSHPGDQEALPEVAAGLSDATVSHDPQISQLEGVPGDVLVAVRAAADWLATIQQPDGSLGISASLAAPQWPTSYAILLWSNQAGYRSECDRATNWLVGQRGRVFPRNADGLQSHDTTIAGWPWVADTYSWVEPTALAVLALGRQGLVSHARTADGLRLIRDRAIATGGWNYGSPAIFDVNLRAQPAPTALALLALRVDNADPGMVDRGTAYLESVLPETRAAQSLGWGLLALNAWGIRPQQANRWLGEAFEKVVSRPDAAPQLAYLLLGAGTRSLDLLGIKPEKSKS